MRDSDHKFGIFTSKASVLFKRIIVEMFDMTCSTYQEELKQEVITPWLFFCDIFKIKFSEWKRICFDKNFTTNVFK